MNDLTWEERNPESYHVERIFISDYLADKEQNMKDDIREGIKGILEHYFSEELGEGASDDIVEEILEVLDKNNVVQIEEKELPENPYEDHVHLDAGKYDGLYRKRYFEAQQDMLRWHKDSIKRLI